MHALLAQGFGIKAICGRLGLSRGTVRRFARAHTVEELLTHNDTGRRPSLLEEFKPYLHQRWNAGCTNAAMLFAEITARGYRGGQSPVRHYRHQFRIPRPPSTPPSVPQATCWIMTDPATIDSTDQAKLDAILAASPDLTALVAHVRAFATMMGSLRGQDLETWMTVVDADDQPELRSFVRGLRRDQDAVAAGLTLHWNSGIVEGHVKRLKMLKRQMFGRAYPDHSAGESCLPADLTGQITETVPEPYLWGQHCDAVARLVELCELLAVPMLESVPGSMSTSRPTTRCTWGTNGTHPTRTPRSPRRTWSWCSAVTCRGFRSRTARTPTRTSPWSTPIRSRSGPRCGTCQAECFARADLGTAVTPLTSFVRERQLAADTAAISRRMCGIQVQQQKLAAAISERERPDGNMITPEYLTACVREATAGEDTVVLKEGISN
ncbi:MAG TPA: transposase [Lentzea sp.]